MSAAPATPLAVHDAETRRWSMLGLLSLAELLGMSLWFAGSAVAPQLRERWTLSGMEVGWLTSAVQLGFGEKAMTGVTKPALGHFAKAGVAPQRILTELRMSPADGWPWACST